MEYIEGKYPRTGNPFKDAYLGYSILLTLSKRISGTVGFPPIANFILNLTKYTKYYWFIPILQLLKLYHFTINAQTDGALFYKYNLIRLLSARVNYRFTSLFIIIHCVHAYKSNRQLSAYRTIPVENYSSSFPLPLSDTVFASRAAEFNSSIERVIYPQIPPHATLHSRAPPSSRPI